MKVLLVAVAVLLPLTAYAESMSSTDEDGKLTITREPCVKAGPWFLKWKMARWIYRGKHYDACWNVADTRDGGKTIVVIDSDGQISQIHPRNFRKDEGT